MICTHSSAHWQQASELTALMKNRALYTNDLLFIYFCIVFVLVIITVISSNAYVYVKYDHTLA